MCRPPNLVRLSGFPYVSEAVQSRFTQWCEFAHVADMHHFEHLLPPSWTTQINAWLAEDTPSFDYAGYVVGEAEREAFLFGKGKETAVLAGVPFFTEIFHQLGCQCANLPSRSFDNHRQFSQGRMAYARRGGIRTCQACRNCERESSTSPSGRESCTQPSRKM